MDGNGIVVVYRAGWFEAHRAGGPDRYFGATESEARYRCETSTSRHRGLDRYAPPNVWQGPRELDRIYCRG